MQALGAGPNLHDFSTELPRDSWPAARPRAPQWKTKPASLHQSPKTQDEAQHGCRMSLKPGWIYLSNVNGWLSKETHFSVLEGLFRLFGLLILWFSVRLQAFFVFPGWSAKCHSAKTLTYKIATARPVSQASRPKKLLLAGCQFSFALVNLGILPFPSSSLFMSM